jgi:hypothetical protein
MRINAHGQVAAKRAGRLAFRSRFSEIYLNVVEMGTRDLWCGRGLSLLRRNRGPEYRPATGGTVRRDSTGSPEAMARAHEPVERAHPGANATDGLVTEPPWLPK